MCETEEMKRFKRQLFSQPTIPAHLASKRSRLSLTKSKMKQPEQTSMNCDEELETALALSAVDGPHILDPRANEWSHKDDMDYIRQRKQLRNRDINGAQACIRKKYPNIGGLNNTQWGRYLQFQAVEQTRILQVCSTQYYFSNSIIFNNEC